MQLLRVNAGKSMQQLSVVRTFRGAGTRPPIAMLQDGRFVYMSGHPVTDPTHLEIVPDHFRFAGPQGRAQLAAIERELDAIESGQVAATETRRAELEALRSRIEAVLSGPSAPGVVRLETERQVVTEPGVPAEEFHAELTPHQARMAAGAAVATGDVTREEVNELRDSLVTMSQGLENVSTVLATLVRTVQDLKGPTAPPATGYDCAPCRKPFKTLAARKAHDRAAHPAGAA